MKQDKDISPAYTLGIEGERLAAEFLEAVGYRVLERRCRIGGIEIDLIARRDDILAFVEVKTRTSDALVAPERAVDVKKQRRMIAAADRYVRDGNLDCEIRFDIVSIVKNGRREDIRHIENAFPPFV